VLSLWKELEMLRIPRRGVFVLIDMNIDDAISSTAVRRFVKEYETGVSLNVSNRSFFNRQRHHTDDNILERHVPGNTNKDQVLLRANSAFLPKTSNGAQSSVIHAQELETSNKINSLGTFSSSDAEMDRETGKTFISESDTMVGNQSPYDELCRRGWLVASVALELEDWHAFHN